MTRQANILLDFMSSSFDSKGVGLRENPSHNSQYQRVINATLTRSIYKAESIEFFGRQLTAVADHAYLARQMDAVKLASLMMLALPISKPLTAVARYYQALCTKREGDFDGARLLLEQVAEEATPKYRSRALLTIGGTYFDSGKVEASLPFYLETGNASQSCDLLTLAQSQKMLAVIRSIQGDHKQAVDDLERLLPMVRAIGRYYPAFYYEYLNSLAVELGELGRVEQAQRVCDITLGSAYAAAYPEFAQTRDEIEAKLAASSATFVAIGVAVEPAPATQLQSSRKVKLRRSIVFAQFARDKVSVQTSIAVAVAAIAHLQTATNILSRVHHSIIPRGPPLLSEFVRNY